MSWLRLICARSAICALRFSLPGIVLLLALGSGEAKEPACALSGDSIRAEDPALAERACSVLEELRERLGDCELAALDGVTFRMVEGLPPERGDPLAAYDAGSDLILLMPPEAVERALTARSAYRGLPPDALYDSLIAHELAHAYVARVAPRNAQYPMAQEYVSYVLQMDAMPAGVRQMLLERFPRSVPVEASELNLFVAQAAPVRFGVKAWRHFTQPEGGCETLQRVLRGEPVFPRAD